MQITVIFPKGVFCLVSEIKGILLNSLSLLLEDTARYAGLLLAPAEGFGLRPRAFFALRAKKGLIMLFWPIFGNFLCPVVTLVTFSSNLSNFERNRKKPKKSKKNPKKFKKIQKNSKNQKIKKNQKNQKNLKKK